MLECLGHAALRTLLLAVVVQLGLGLLRTKRPQLQAIAWTVVLAASLSMPVLQWATPLRLPVLPVSGADLIRATDVPRQASVFQPSTPAPVQAVTAPATALPWMEASYLLVAGVLLLRLAIGIALSLRLVGRAERIRSDWVADAHIRISRDIAAPVTFANVILLPWNAVQWPTATRDAVLAHERAHIARRDFAMLLASQVNQAVFWFSPLSWWLHRRLAALAELASDDRALTMTGDRSGYAEVLLEMGRRSGPLLRGLAMARPATLKNRIERVLADGAPTAPVGLVRRMMLAGGAAVVSILAASSWTYAAPPPAPVSFAEQGWAPTPADRGASPLAPVGQGAPNAVPGWARAAVALQDAPEPVAVARAARAPSATVRGTVPPAVRQTTRTTVPALPSRSMVQRVRADRGLGAQDGPALAKTAVLAGSAPRGGDVQGVANGFDGSADAPAGSETLPVKRGGEPSCTGAYVPRPGGSRTDAAADFVQAVYFQEADGTPWLKLFLGVRNRARLTGLEVERTSFRTTVVTTLPRGTSRVTGTTHGTYGAIDFECVRPTARL